jgi:hypothetical protein
MIGYSNIRLLRLRMFNKSHRYREVILCEALCVCVWCGPNSPNNSCWNGNGAVFFRYRLCTCPRSVYRPWKWRNSLLGTVKMMNFSRRQGFFWIASVIKNFNLRGQDDVQNVERNDVNWRILVCPGYSWHIQLRVSVLGEALSGFLQNERTERNSSCFQLSITSDCGGNNSKEIERKWGIHG